MAATALAAPPPSVLVHEHVLVDFIGADQIRPGRYDREEVFKLARPKLEELKRAGCAGCWSVHPTSWVAIPSCWRDYPMPSASRSGQIQVCTGPQIISSFLRLQQRNRLNNWPGDGSPRRKRHGVPDSSRSV